MGSLESSIRKFDQLYRDFGIRSQRSYPNEQCITFIAQNWFSTPFEERKNIRILEVGCGSGANLWMMAKEGFSAYGVDSSQSGLEIAKTHLEAKWGVEAALECGSVTSLPYEDAFFDAAVDVVTLQHLNLADSEVALQEINRVLRPGGKFFSYRLSDKSVMFMNSGGQFIDAATVTNVEDRRLPLANNGPMSFWSPALAREMYGKAGLSIDSIDSFGRTYQSGISYVEYLGICASSPA